MKKKFLLLAGCLFAYIGLQPTLAQTDVTSTYLANPSFENGTDGWTLPTATQYYNNGVYTSADAVPSNLGTKSEPSDGSYFFHTRHGWNGKSGVEWNTYTLTSTALPVGKYYLSCDYKAYDKCDNSGYHSQLQLAVTSEGGDAIASTAYKQLFAYFADNASNSYITTADWTPIGLFFEITTETVVKIAINAKFWSNSRSDYMLDNFRLYAYTEDDITESSPWDVSGTIPNSRMEAGALVWPSLASHTNTSYANQSGFYMLEKWTDKAGNLGDMNVTQTLSGLPNGKYRLSAAINATKQGSSDLSSMTGVTLYAGSQSVPVATSEGAPEIFSVDAVVTDGTLPLGVKTSSCAINWLSWDNVTLQYLGPDLSALSTLFNDALTAAKAVDPAFLNNGVKNELSAAITTYDGNEPATRVAYETAINALTTVTNKANEVALLYPRLAGYNAVYANSIATTTQKAAYKAVLDEQSALIEAATTAAAISEALNTIETARRTYVQVAQPTNGTTFDFTFLIDGVGNSTSGWKRDFGSQNYTYKTSTEKNTETCVSAGFIEMWNSSPLSGTLTYTKSGLPNGLYNLSAYVFGNQQGTTSLTAGAASVALSTDTKLFQDLTVSGAEVSDGSLTFGLSVTDDNWVGITNVRLAYAGSAHAYADYTAAKATADAYLDKVISASIKATINANNTLTESNTSAELLQAVANLNEAVAEAAVSEANYAYLQREVATAKSVGVDVTAWEAAIAAATYSTEEALAEGRKANVATYNQVETAYTHNSEISNAWSGEIGTATGQHWSGNASTSYYDTNGTNITRSLTNSVTLPAGEYVFKGAGRSNANTSMTLQIGDNTVTYTAKGDTGYGIDTSGAANYDAGGTYANNNAGRGWEWEFVHLTLTEETTVTLTATIKTSGWGWGSFSDLSLKMSDESYKEYCYPLLATALGECAPWTTGDTYADTTYPSYQTNYTNKTYATGDEVLAAIAELRAAYKAYAISFLDKDHPYDVTSLIVNPSFDDGMNGWGAAQNSTDGYTQSTAGGVYSYSASKQLRHASIYQTIESLEAGVYTLSAKVKGDPLADDKTYIYATTGTVDHWANPVFDGYVTYGYYTTANNGAEKVVSTTFVLSETSNVRIGILSWGNNVSGNTKGGFSVDEWTLKRVLYGVDGEASAPVITGAIPASDLQALVDGGISAIDLTAATGLSAVALTTTANPNLLVYAASGQVSNTSNVIVDGVCARLKLTDGHPFMAPTAFTATAAEYEMGAVASDAAGTVSFGTLCLPFEVSTLAGNAYKLDQGVTLGGEIYATSVTTLPANTPALVTSKGTYSGSGAVSATPAGTLCTGGELVGVYSSTPAPVGSMVLQKHSDKVAFYLVDEVQPTVKPFRAYIRPQSNEVKMASVLFDDATGLTGVSVETGLTVVKRYNSAGQAISRPEKGINLLRMSDGSVRKVLVK